MNTFLWVFVSPGNRHERLALTAEGDFDAAQFQQVGITSTCSTNVESTTRGFRCPSQEMMHGTCNRQSKRMRSFHMPYWKSKSPSSDMNTMIVSSAARGVQGFEDLADILVDPGNHCVVNGQVLMFVLVGGPSDPWACCLILNRVPSGPSTPRGHFRGKDLVQRIGPCTWPGPGAGRADRQTTRKDRRAGSLRGPPGGTAPRFAGEVGVGELRIVVVEHGRGPRPHCPSRSTRWLKNRM